MEHEMIDYLDEKTGKVIGVIDKSIAHRDGLWHRTVHVWIVNDNNQILLQQRCAKKKFYPNIWDVSFAGHIGAGESSMTTAIREGEEELGIQVDVKKLKYLFTNKEELSYDKIRSNEFVDIYLLQQNIDIKHIVLQKEEVSGIKYVSINEFYKMAYSKDIELFPHINEYEQLKKYLEEEIR
jgi:isopentenyl-diphosphate delta-isomerase type 1